MPPVHPLCPMKRKAEKKPFVSTADGAKLKAMRLLMYRPRSEKELYDRLAEAGFEPEHTEEGMAYVKSFGYLDDEKYAASYVAAVKDSKSISLIMRELAEKGVDETLAAKAVEEAEIDEEETAYRLFVRRAGSPHPLDEAEERRLYGYFARRGFSAGVFFRTLKKYRNACGGDE